MVAKSWIMPPSRRSNSRMLNASCRFGVLISTEPSDESPFNYENFDRMLLHIHVHVEFVVAGTNCNGGATDGRLESR